MDKFGIFNVINSLVGMYNKAQSQEKNNSISQAPSSTIKKEKNSMPTSIAPLQHNMINTMVSHEAFVKRVLEKHKN